MKAIITFLLLLFFSQAIIRAQGTDFDYERIKIGEARHMISGLALSPDMETLAIAGTQSFPYYLFDWKKQEVKEKFNVGNWYAGASVNYSAQGNFLLLNQLKYVDWAPNKDREVNFEVVDVKNGKRVKRFESVHSVKITPDEKYIVALSGDELGFWNLSSKKKEKSFTVAEATNSIAISPDGQLIAVSHRLYEKDAKQISQLQRDKKSMKNALKYKQQISVFDANTFKKLYTINELYDIVYRLEFTPDGNILMCLQIPHTKMQNTTTTRQTYLNLVDMQTLEPLRRGFTSNAIYEPDFKLSHDGRLFGIVSQSNQFLELHIYDFETRKMLYRYQQSYRLFEKNEGGMIAADSRVSFVFLPGNEAVMMTMGNHLIQWNFEPKE